MPAAINERDLVPGLCAGAEHLAGLLNDKGFNGRAFTETLAEQGLTNLVPPTRAERKTMPRFLQKIMPSGATASNHIRRAHRHMERHHAPPLHGLITRTAAPSPAHTLARSPYSTLKTHTS